MAELRLEELRATTIVAANNLTLKPRPGAVRHPASYAIADSFVNPATSWPRVVLDGDEVVGYIMGNFDPEACRKSSAAASGASTSPRTRRAAASASSPCGVRRGGRAAASTALTVVWEPGEEGPEEVLPAVGFEIVGQTPYGENIGALAL